MLSTKKPQKQTGDITQGCELVKLAESSLENGLRTEFQFYHSRKQAVHIFPHSFIPPDGKPLLLGEKK